MAIRQHVGALFTDLYEVTMAQAYWAERMSGTAVFEIFFRKLPPGRSYIMAAGLADVVEFLEAFRFDEQDLRYLRGLGQFSDEFLRWLAGVRFTGDVWAAPEGTVIFPNEPAVQLIAPIIEAQLVETFVLNQIHLQSVLASKVARTSYLAGAAGTSNLLAARQYGIPTFGTMAHSFVQAFDSEVAAFEAFARLYPATMLLVDTYDTLRGVDHVIELAKRLGNRFDVRAVRLDSGDLDELSKATRARLDTAGLEQVEIFASSGLDENRIAALLAARCPIDGFGVGTQLVVAQDAPALDMAYKLVAYDGSGRTKFSSGKVIYPGRKQVFRKLEHGVFCGDTLGEHGENLPGDPLLVPIMTNGRRIRQHAPTLDGARDWARQQIDALPPELRSLEDTGYSYPVAVSDRIVGELARLRHADTAEAHPGSNVVGAKAKRP